MLALLAEVLAKLLDAQAQERGSTAG